MHDLKYHFLSLYRLWVSRSIISWFFSTYWTKFNVKITKMKWNYMANMIMNVPETVCQFVHYFRCEQGLAIDLPWPTLKSKQRTCIELFNVVSWSVWILILLAFGAITKYIINEMPHSMCARKGGGDNWTFKQSNCCRVWQFLFYFF